MANSLIQWNQGGLHILLYLVLMLWFIFQLTTDHCLFVCLVLLTQRVCQTILKLSKVIFRTQAHVKVVKFFRNKSKCVCICSVDLTQLDVTAFHCEISKIGVGRGGGGLLRRSEFESHWSLQFFCKIVFERNKNKQKEAGVGPL